MNTKEKKPYQTPETEVILFGEDIITTSSDFDFDMDYDGGISTDFYF